MKKLKFKRAKGFTLIEVIIVLVILAAMASLLIPSLIGYINKANENTAITEASRCVTAAQTLVTEHYAVTRIVPTIGSSGTDITYTEIIKLAEVNGSITACTAPSGKITGLTYTTTDSIVVSYTINNGSGEYTIS